MQEAPGTKPLSLREQFADQVKAIRAMRAVEWAYIGGDGNLYVCTAANKLRHTNPSNGYKYLPRFMLRIPVTDRNPYRVRMKYRSVLRFVFTMNQHPRLKMTPEWGLPCLGDHVDDYREARDKYGLKGAAESLIQTLQVIY